MDTSWTPQAGDINSIYKIKTVEDLKAAALAEENRVRAQMGDRAKLTDAQWQQVLNGLPTAIAYSHATNNTDPYSVLSYAIYLQGAEQRIKDIQNQIAAIPEYVKNHPADARNMQLTVNGLSRELNSIRALQAQVSKIAPMFEMVKSQQPTLKDAALYQAFATEWKKPEVEKAKQLEEYMKSPEHAAVVASGTPNAPEKPTDYLSTLKKEEPVTYQNIGGTTYSTPTSQVAQPTQTQSTAPQVAGYWSETRKLTKNEIIDALEADPATSTWSSAKRQTLATSYLAGSISGEFKTQVTNALTTYAKSQGYALSSSGLELTKSSSTTAPTGTQGTSSTGTQGATGTQGTTSGNSPITKPQEDAYSMGKEWQESEVQRLMGLGYTEEQARKQLGMYDQPFNVNSVIEAMNASPAFKYFPDSLKQSMAQAYISKSIGSEDLAMIEPAVQAWLKTKGYTLTADKKGITYTSAAATGDTYIDDPKVAAERLAVANKKIDDALSAGTITPAQAQMFKLGLAQWNPKDEIKIENIISEFARIQRETIDPQFKYVIGDAIQQLQSSKTELDRWKADTLGTQQHNLEGAGMTFSGLAQKEIGEEAAIRGYTGQQGNLQKDYNQTLEGIRRIAEQKLGSEKAKQMGFEPLIGGFEGTIQQDRSGVEAGVASKLYNLEKYRGASQADTWQEYLPENFYTPLS